uniref:Multiple epidermal growth factor-like domains 10 n=1 Tax=Magallana gigas TaxID=29159 RepID=A0A8W8JJF9_MAGGI
MPGNGTFSLVDPETDKEVKPVLAVHVMKTSIENHYVFGTHDSTSSHPGLLLLEPLPFNGTEYVSSNRRMLTTVPIYVSRLLRHFKCYPGYLGWNCSEQCRYPNYGRDCQELCKCEEKLCDIADGCIAPDKTNCPPGYLGRNCSERCPYPKYGIDCQHMCGCEEKLCDVATGCISPADEADCPSGYQGHNCSKQCHYPNYENIAMDSASVKRSLVISPVDNDLKSEESHESMVKQITGHTLLAVIVSVSVLSSVLMSAIISLVIWRLKKPNRTIMRASSPVQEQQTLNKATTLGAANTYCFNDDARLSHFYSSPIELSTSLKNPE